MKYIFFFLVIFAAQAQSTIVLKMPDKNINIETSVGVDILVDGNDVNSGVEIDTIITLADYILLDHTNSLWGPTEDSKNYALILNEGLNEIDGEYLRWQEEFEIERTKIFGKTKYKSIRIPFQFIKDTIVLEPQSNKVWTRVFGSEGYCISYYLDNKPYRLDASCTPGIVDYHGYPIRRHSSWISGLKPNTEYLLRVEGVSESGEFNFMEVKIKTLE